jgi:hypothetical protein
MSDEPRNKTQKKIQSPLDISGALALGFSEKTFQMLSNDADNALKRPWHKLERGLRIGRIREYVERETVKMNLCEEDKNTLFKLLCSSLDRKMLSSKASVTYDHEKEQITEIKGLVSHSAYTGRTKYQFIEKKPIGTQRKRSNKETPTLISNGGTQQ